MDIERFEAHAQSEIKRRRLACADPLWSCVQWEERACIHPDLDTTERHRDTIRRDRDPPNLLSIAAESDWSEFGVEFEDKSRARTC